MDVPNLSAAIDAALPGLVLLAGAGLAAALAGSWLAFYWHARHRRRELDLRTAETFHRLYGEFFALWQLWSYWVEDLRGGGAPAVSRWELLERATAAEAGVEAVLGTLASQRALPPETVADLGRFRQAFRSLREAIRDGKPVEGRTSSDERYRSFQELATSVAALIHSGRLARSRGARGRARAWLEITSSKWKGTWIRPGAEEGSRPGIG